MNIDWSNRAAAHRHAVVFCVDAGYLPFALCATSQIVALQPDAEFDICICSTTPLTLPAIPSPLARRIRMCSMTGAPSFGKKFTNDRRADITFLRLSVPAAFAGQYQRILYLDAAIYVHDTDNAPDFGRLLATDLAGHAVAAVRDNKQWRDPTKQPGLFKKLGLSQAKYLNGGVLLLDVDAFNHAEILPACVDFAQRWDGILPDNDQGLLNAVLKGNWVELSPLWNWQQTLKIPLLESRYPIAITHFIGPIKPWQDDRGVYLRKYRQHYADFLSANVPQMDFADPKRPPKRLKQILKTTAKSLWRAGQTNAFVARFPDIYKAL